MFSKNNKRNVKVLPANKTEQLNSNNPYIIVPQTDDSLNENIDVNLLNNQPISLYIPDDLLEKAIALDQKNCSVRCIIMVDIIMSCLYFMNGLFFGLICFLISLSGYLATISYKKSLMTCYVIYQYLQVFGRFINLIAISTWPEQFGYTYINTNNSSNVHQNTQGEYYLAVLLYFTLFFCQFIIAGIITQYYKLLPTTKELDRIKHYLPS